MNTVIIDQSKKILLNIKEVFIHFDNSAINDDAQSTIKILLGVVVNEKVDKDQDVQGLLNSVCRLNTQLQPSFTDQLQRSVALYSKEQTDETAAICGLITARINTLIMILAARLETHAKKSN